jgi:hypothetical protein
VNSAKIIYAPKEVLTEKVTLQRKIIKENNEKIKEEEVSNGFVDIAHVVAKDVMDKKIDISALHRFFKSSFVFNPEN